MTVRSARLGSLEIRAGLMECLAAREGERRNETRSAAVVLSKTKSSAERKISVTLQVCWHVKNAGSNPWEGDNEQDGSKRQLRFRRFSICGNQSTRKA